MLTFEMERKQVSGACVRFNSDALNFKSACFICHRWLCGSVGFILIAASLFDLGCLIQIGQQCGEVVVEVAPCIRKVKVEDLVLKAFFAVKKVECPHSPEEVVEDSTLPDLTLENGEVSIYKFVFVVAK